MIKTMFGLAAIAGRGEHKANATISNHRIEKLRQRIFREGPIVLRAKAAEKPVLRNVATELLELCGMIEG
jgi:hypothetical protein